MWYLRKFMLLKRETISAVSGLALKTKQPVKAELPKAKLTYSLHPGFWVLSMHESRGRNEVFS